MVILSLIVQLIRCTLELITKFYMLNIRPNNIDFIIICLLLSDLK